MDPGQGEAAVGVGCLEVEVGEAEVGVVGVEEGLGDLLAASWDRNFQKTPTTLILTDEL